MQLGCAVLNQDKIIDMLFFIGERKSKSTGLRMIAVKHDFQIIADHSAMQTEHSGGQNRVSLLPVKRRIDTGRLVVVVLDRVNINQRIFAGKNLGNRVTQKRIQL